MDRRGVYIDGGVECRTGLRSWNADIGYVEDGCENKERIESVRHCRLKIDILVDVSTNLLEK
jgi:hypothetical protein